MLSPDETFAGLRRADYVLAIGDWGFGAEVLEANSHLKGIGCAYERPEIYGLSVATATRLKIPVTNLHITSYIDSTAELTLAFLMALAWRIPEADRYTRCGRFRQEQSIMFTTTSLAGKTLGLVGLGKVARAFAPMVAGLRMNVVYTKRTRLDTAEEELPRRHLGRQPRRAPVHERLRVAARRQQPLERRAHRRAGVRA